MVSEEEKERVAKDIIAMCDAIGDDKRLVMAAAVIIRNASRDSPSLTTEIVARAFLIDDAIEADLAEAMAGDVVQS